MVGVWLRRDLIGAISAGFGGIGEASLELSVELSLLVRVAAVDALVGV